MYQINEYTDAQSNSSFLFKVFTFLVNFYLKKNLQDLIKKDLCVKKRSIQEGKVLVHKQYYSISCIWLYFWLFFLMSDNTTNLRLIKDNLNHDDLFRSSRRRTSSSSRCARSTARTAASTAPKPNRLTASSGRLANDGRQGV